MPYPYDDPTPPPIPPGYGGAPPPPPPPGVPPIPPGESPQGGGNIPPGGSWEAPPPGVPYNYTAGNLLGQVIGNDQNRLWSILAPHESQWQRGQAGVVGRQDLRRARQGGYLSAQDDAYIRDLLVAMQGLERTEPRPMQGAYSGETNWRYGPRVQNRLREGDAVMLESWLNSLRQSGQLPRGIGGGGNIRIGRGDLNVLRQYASGDVLALINRLLGNEAGGPGPGPGPGGGGPRGESGPGGGRHGGSDGGRFTPASGEGGFQGADGAPWSDFDPSLPGNIPEGFGNSAYGDLMDPVSQMISLIPVLETMRNHEIWESMAQAGFTGNRYGTGAMRKAGEIGRETTEAMQAAFSRILSDQANRSADRSLAAAGMGGQLGMSIDQLMRNRLNELSDFGRYEQNRTDDIARILFNDFRENQYGLLPYLIQAASGSNASPIPFSSTVEDPDTFDRLLEILGLFT